jgi:hypothetical protein
MIINGLPNKNRYRKPNSICNRCNRYIRYKMQKRFCNEINSHNTLINLVFEKPLQPLHRYRNEIGEAVKSSIIALLRITIIANYCYFYYNGKA